MSAIIPAADAEFVMWINDHAVRWAQAHADIGMSQAQSDAFTASAAETTDDWRAYLAAQQSLILARDRWLAGEQRTRGLARAAVRTIKTFAATAEQPVNVYTQAAIPAPKQAVYGQAPGRPTSVRATLNTVTGHLRLRWKCRNPDTSSGTVYIVERRAGGAWVQIGLCSTRTFTDTTLSGWPTVEYQVTAQRSGISGVPSGPVVVNLGTGEDGGWLGMPGLRAAA